MLRIAAVLALCSGCHRVFELEDRNTRWNAPQRVALDWTWNPGDGDPSFTGDSLELYFNQGDRIVRSTRTTTEEPWPAPLEASELGSGVRRDDTPEVIADGLALYFVSDRGTNTGAFDVWFSTRLERGAIWEPPARVLELSTVSSDTSPSADAENLSIVVTTPTKAENLDLYLSDRDARTSSWPPPLALAAVNSEVTDEAGFLTSDGLALYFTSTRAGSSDLYVARRASKRELFGAPEPLTELNSEAADTDPWVDPTGTEIYFVSDRSGTAELWQATR